MEYSDRVFTEVAVFWLGKLQSVENADYISRGKLFRDPRLIRRLKPARQTAW